MSTSSVREIVRRKRRGYLKARKGEKKRILDEVQELTGYHRKSLVRLFLQGVSPRNAPIRPPRASKYEPIPPAVIRVRSSKGRYTEECPWADVARWKPRQEKADNELKPKERRPYKPAPNHP